MAQKRVIVKEAIFPTAKNQLKQSDMCRGPLGGKEKAGPTPGFVTYLLCGQGCVTGNI